jgi:hypothetical protein
MNSSPQDIAKMIFKSPPREPNSIQIVSYSKVYDEDETSLNFEIFITIYLEGFMNILQVIRDSYIDEGGSYGDKDDLDIYKSVYADINIDDLRFPNEWFKSFGYKINISEYSPENQEELDNFKENIKPNSYCRILLSFEPRDQLYFIKNNNSNLYTFVLNGDYKITNKLENIFAILSKDDKFYKISFAVNL